MSILVREKNTKCCCCAKPSLSKVMFFKICVNYMLVLYKTKFVKRKLVHTTAQFIYYCYTKPSLPKAIKETMLNKTKNTTCASKYIIREYLPGTVKGETSFLLTLGSSDFLF